MIRFRDFEQLGLTLAAITGRSDGDCREPGLDTPRHRACHALGIPPAALACGRQVHGTAIAIVTEKERGRGALDWDSAFPATDGLITNVPGLPLAVFVADCVPVFLYAPEARVAALVHAGREGTRANIAACAIQRMCEHFALRAGSLFALIGPSAGPDCYEVSETLADEWQAAGLPRNGRNLDLWAANRAQIQDAGIHTRQIFTAGICTIHDDRFFSYRRGDATARNMAVVMI